MDFFRCFGWQRFIASCAGGRLFWQMAFTLLTTAKMSTTPCITESLKNIETPVGRILFYLFSKIGPTTYLHVFIQKI